MTISYQACGVRKGRSVDTNLKKEERKEIKEMKRRKNICKTHLRTKSSIITSNSKVIVE